MSWAVLLAVAVLWMPAGQGRAQQTPTETEPSEWIRPEEVPARADALLRRLETVRPDSQPDSWLNTIEEALPRLGKDLDKALAHASEAIDRSSSPADLEDIRREVMSTSAPLDGWKNALGEEGKRVAQLLDELDDGVRMWSATRARPETIAAGDVVVRRIDSSIDALHATTGELRAWRARVLAASDRVIDDVAATDAALEKLRAASVAERASLFLPDREPLWAFDFGTQLRGELPRVPGMISSYTESTFAYIARDPRPLVVQLLMAGILMFALGRLSARALPRLRGEDALSRAARLLERPYAIALLLTLIATPLFHPLAPRRFMQLIAALALFPVARIVIHASPQARVGAFVTLFVLLLLDRMGQAVQPLPGFGRLVYILTLGTALGLLVWLLRRIDILGFPPWVRRIAHLGIAVLVVALLAEVGGWTNLATLLGRGVIASAITGLYLCTAAIALSAVGGYALSSRTARRIHLIGSNTQALQRRADGVVRWLGVALWLYFVSTAVGLSGVAADAITRLLGAGVAVGTLSVSLGGILAFALTWLAAMLLARVVTAVLEEDIYPRAHLPRGMPYVLSTLVRYGFYSLGFLLALGAAGVQLGQVAFMLGGLGIGIGLGLQDLVKNFAAGLTLLFERSVQVGDTLEMPSQGIFGRVVSIGMRASVVRSWNGADVVVPNADLISSSVTNWTLSDRLCRIEVAVGVAYGTDPEQVMALLLDAVRSNERLLSAPAPMALFKGFGESSLDFVVRAWIDEGYEMALQRTSDLTLAVHRRLIDAGVSIPFPQRDLHVTSVAPEVGASLSRRD